MSRRVVGRADEFRGKWRARLRGKHIGLFETERLALAAIDRALGLEANKPPETCRSYVEAWFESRELSEVVANVAPQKSDWHSRVDIPDEKGHRWLDIPPKLVRTVHLQRWVKALAKQRCKSAIVVGGKRNRTTVIRKTGKLLSHESVTKAVSLVRLFFAWLKTEGLYEGQNPAEGIMIPVRKGVRKAGEQRIVHLTQDEVRALFELEMEPWRRAAFAVAIYSGLRRAELWGLRWEYVLWGDAATHPQLLVRASYDGECKSASSVRNVPLLPFAKQCLHDYWRTLSPRPLSGYVFPADSEGRHCHTRDYDAGWRDKKERRGPGGKLRTVPGWRSKAGIRPEVTFHCMRHTTGCYLIQGTFLGNAEPMTLQEVSKWLGHSSLQVTERHYADLAPGNLQDKAFGVRTTQRRRQSGTPVVHAT